MATPATICNSRFTSGFPHLAGIFVEKTRKSSSGTPTSRSHNSLVQNLIRVNFISLESRCRELSVDMLHDLFWAPEGLQNYPRKSGQKRVMHENWERFGGGAAWRIRMPCGRDHASLAMVTCRAPRSRARRATLPINKALPPLFQHNFCSALGRKIGVWGLP